MNNQLTLTPSQKLTKTFAHDFEKRIRELGVLELDYLENGYRFKHNGYHCEIIFKAK